MFIKPYLENVLDTFSDVYSMVDIKDLDLVCHHNLSLSQMLSVRQSLSKTIVKLFLKSDVDYRFLLSPVLENLLTAGVI